MKVQMVAVVVALLAACGPGSDLPDWIRLPEGWPLKGVTVDAGGTSGTFSFVPPNTMPTPPIDVLAEHLRPLWGEVIKLDNRVLVSGDGRYRLTCSGVVTIHGECRFEKKGA
jgi:hypothetical protein